MKKTLSTLTILSVLFFFSPNPAFATATTYDPANISSDFTLSGGNLIATHSAADDWGTGYATNTMSTGKCYFEIVLTSINTGVAADAIGIAKVGTSATGEFEAASTGYGYRTNGTKVNSNSGSAYGSTWAAGAVIGVYYDADAGTLGFLKDNVDQGTAFTGLSGTFMAASDVYEQNAVMTGHFSAASFTYTPPTGYTSLDTCSGGGASAVSRPIWLPSFFFF